MRTHTIDKRIAAERDCQSLTGGIMFDLLAKQDPWAINSIDLNTETSLRLKNNL